MMEQADVMRERGPDRVSPFFLPSVLVDSGSGQLAISLGIRGPNYAVVSACATGSHAIGEGAELIRRGDADAVLAGGTEAAMHPLILAGFCAMRGLAAEEEYPPRASRPFDATRAGFVIGEGACMLLLEELEAARARGATIYAEVLGYGASNDAYHMAAPDPDSVGVAEMMRAALRRAGVEPERVDYINAHGTSTPLGDAAETKAIKDVFGDHAYELAVSSTKSVTGHCFGAAGAIEAMMCVARDPPRRHPADDELRDAGSRVRPRLRPERSARGTRRRGAVERDGPGRPQRLRAARPRHRLTRPTRYRLSGARHPVGKQFHGLSMEGARYTLAPRDWDAGSLAKRPGLEAARFRHMDCPGWEVCRFVQRPSCASAARSTASGVSSASESSTRSASASASSPGGKCAFGMAITAMPAARAARMPLWESSTAAARAGSTPRRRAASR